MTPETKPKASPAAIEAAEVIAKLAQSWWRNPAFMQNMPSYFSPHIQSALDTATAEARAGGATGGEGVNRGSD